MWQLNEESPVQLPYTRDKEIKKIRFFINPFLALLVFILGNRTEFFPPNTCDASLSFLITLTVMVLQSEADNAKNSRRTAEES